MHSILLYFIFKITESRIRLITVRMAIRLLTDLVCSVNCGCQLSDQHFAEIINAREEAMLVLRSYFEVFLLYVYKLIFRSICLL